MTGDEIKSVFSGSKWEGLTRRSQTYYTIMHPDGSFEYLNTESQWNDSGKWFIKGSEFCSQWNNIRGGQVACNKFFDKGDGVYLRVREDRHYELTKTGDKTFKIKKLKSTAGGC